MTTIAYKDGIIAYDSRSVRGGTITNDDFDKCTIIKGVRFFLIGSVSDHDNLTGAYFGEEASKSNATAFVVDNGLYLIGIDDNGLFWKQSLKQYKTYSDGSGCDHALTAMDCGLSAKQAVKMAIKRDWGSGGKVRTFKVK